MYEEHLTNKSIFFSWQTPLLIFLFFAVRIFSYFLDGHAIIQTVLVFCLIMLLGILYFKNPDWALYLVLGEFFLGGNGHFLEFINLSIRTIFISFYLVLWGSDQVGNELFKHRLKINNTLQKILPIFLFFLIMTGIVGLLNNNGVKAVGQSAIPYLFLILIFPTFHVFKNENAQRFLIRCLLVFIIGSALMSLALFIYYSAGFGILQDSVYSWYVNIAMGNITNLGNGFYKIAEPGHLLIVPFILIICSLLMRDEKHHKMWRVLLILSILILVINLSRDYFFALIVGLLILKYKHKWYRFLIVTTTTIGLTLLIFISINLLASNGLTFGFEQFGIKINNIATPQIVINSPTRPLLLLSDWEAIKANPIFGTGLGSSITYTDPVTYEVITTKQFDWGYLQMFLELGLFGLLSFLGIIIFTISSIIKKIRSYADYQEFDVGLLAGLIAFIILNITAPALFHIFGIIYLIFVLTLSLKPADTIFDQLINLLYRIFNRLKNT